MAEGRDGERGRGQARRAPAPKRPQAKHEFSEDEAVTLQRARPPSRARISLWEEVDIEELETHSQPPPPPAAAPPSSDLVTMTPGPHAFDVEHPRTMRSPSDAPTMASIPVGAPTRSRVALALGAAMLVAAIAVGAV